MFYNKYSQNLYRLTTIVPNKIKPHLDNLENGIYHGYLQIKPNHNSSMTSSE